MECRGGAKFDEEGENGKGKPRVRTVHERAKGMRRLRLQLDVEGAIFWEVEKPMRHSESTERGDEYKTARYSVPGGVHLHFPTDLQTLDFVSIHTAVYFLLCW
jgi:hypothetical protein